MIKESQISGMSKSHNFKDKKKVTKFLGASFSGLKDKNKGWEVLRSLANDSNQFVKLSSIDAIQSSFVYLINKEEAWQYLLNTILESNSNSIVRIEATIVTYKVFDLLPNKEKAWMDLLETVKKSANTNNMTPSFIMQHCFNSLDDKEKYMGSLKPLTDIDDRVIRSFSNNLVGRIYMSKLVNEKGDEFNKTYLEGLIYLKKSFDELAIPSHKFCYVMHNIFNKIIEGELKDVSEINKGIEELKTFSKESTEKQKIIKVLDELYNVLEDTIDAQKKREDISKFKEKIIPIFDQLNILIGTLNNEIIRQIAEKAKERINFEYKSTIRALEIVVQVIEIPDKLISEPNLVAEVLRLCCISISEPLCNFYKTKLYEIEKENVTDKKQAQLLQFFIEIKTVLEHEKTLKEIICSGHSEIKGEVIKLTQKLENYYISINKNGPRQEIVISTGVEMYGTGAQVVTTIPLIEFGYNEFNEDINNIKNNMRLSEIPTRLYDIIKKHIIQNKT